MKDKKIILVIFVFLFLLSFRKILQILFGANDYILGHNWDWPFPDATFLFNKLSILSKYTWWDFNLGTPLTLTISHLAPNSILGFLSYLFGIKIAILSLFASVIILSFFSFKKLLDIIIKNTTINYIPSFLYAFSPFLFNEIIGGSWYMWISYALAPILFINLLKFIEVKKIKYLVGFLLSSIFVISSLQNFLLIETILILYLIYKILIRKNSFKKTILRYSFSHIILVLFNLYWISPFVYSLQNFVQDISKPSFTGAFHAARYSTQGLLNILSLTGYLDRNMYYFALPNFMVPIFNLSVFLIWVLVILPFIGKRKFLKSKSLIWLLILLFMIIFIKGGNLPFSKITMWIYNHFPLMQLYRSPQHLMFVAAFIIPMLIGLSLNYFYNNSKYKKLILSIFSFCIFIWISGWWYNGDLGHKILRDKKKDYIDFYTLSPGIRKIYQQNEETSRNYKVLFLPSVNSAIYLKNEYQNNAQGGQPEYMYLKNPTFTSESNLFANTVETFLCNDIKFNYINYLSLFSVKDVVLRNDIYPHFTDSFDCWDNNRIKKNLDSNNALEDFFTGEYTNAYHIKENCLLPLFYSPQNIIISKKEIKDLPEIVSQPDYQIRSIIYFQNQNKEKGGILKYIPNKIEQTPIVEFKKINPTKYRVRIHGARENLPLVFSENFHEEWKAYLIKPNNLWFPISDFQNNLKEYKVLDDNKEDQATKEEVEEFIQKRWITTLGNLQGKEIKHKKWENNKEKLGYVEKYKIDFISKNSQGTIQNDNLPNGYIWDTWFKKPLDEENHLVANSYANSWWVDLDIICEKSDNCIKNSDGSYDFELIVEFWPQRLFYVGLFISGTTLLTCVSYIIWDWQRRKKSLTKTKSKNGK